MYIFYIFFCSVCDVCVRLCVYISPDRLFVWLFLFFLVFFLLWMLFWCRMDLRLRLWLTYIHTNTLPSKMKINLIPTVALSYIHHSHSCIARSCFGFTVRRHLCKFHVTKYETTFEDYHCIFRSRKNGEPKTRVHERESTRERDMAKKIVAQIMNCNFNFGLTVMRMTKANLTHKVQMTKR